MDCSTPGFPVHHQLSELTQTHVHWVGDAIQPSLPLSSPSPPTFNLSQHQGLFQWVSSSYQVAKVWSFSFSVSPSNEYSGPISFRIVWLDLLAVQGTLKSLLQHHSSKASVLQNSAFFIVQLSHPYTATGKTIALTRWTFFGKVILLFNVLSRLVITSSREWDSPFLSFFIHLSLCLYNHGCHSCHGLSFFSLLKLCVMLVCKFLLRTYVSCIYVLLLCVWLHTFRKAAS